MTATPRAAPPRARGRARRRRRRARAHRVAVPRRRHGRGRRCAGTAPSVNALWGNHQAILAGDYLLAKASELAASISTEVAGLLAATIARLCEGQLAEARDAFDVDAHRGRLLPLDRRQDLGAVRHRLPHRRASSAASTGRRSTPLTDVRPSPTARPSRSSTTCSTSSPPRRSWASPSGHDLLEGTYTLPVIRAMAAPTGGDLRMLLGKPLDSIVAGPRPRARAGRRRRDHRHRDGARRTPTEPSPRWAPPASTEAGAWLVETAEALLDRVVLPSLSSRFVACASLPDGVRRRRAGRLRRRRVRRGRRRRRRATTSSACSTAGRCGPSTWSPPTAPACRSWACGARSTTSCGPSPGGPCSSSSGSARTATAAAARRRRSRRCAAERARRCPACGLLAFPRLAPAMIVLVTRDGGRRGAAGPRRPLPDPDVVVPGRLRRARARRSRRPCTARCARRSASRSTTCATGAASRGRSPTRSCSASPRRGPAASSRCDPTEIAEAGWYRPDDLPPIPPAMSIARRLIDAWVGSAH